MQSARSGSHISGTISTIALSMLHEKSGSSLNGPAECCFLILSRRASRLATAAPSLLPAASTAYMSPLTPAGLVAALKTFLAPLSSRPKRPRSGCVSATLVAFFPTPRRLLGAEAVIVCAPAVNWSPVGLMQSSFSSD